MKRIAVTGISGYIGNRLLYQLEKMDEVERVIGIDIRPPRVVSSKLQFYCRDILEPLDEIFTENEVDSVVHLAFIVKPTHNKKGARQVDIGGTINFLEACRKAHIEQILYLSSHTVYGAHRDNDIYLDEDSPLRPLLDFQYSWDKVKVEHIFSDFAISNNNMCITILRSCPVIGPNAAGAAVTSMFKPVMIRVAGYDPLMQLIHEDDVVNIILTLLSQRRSGTFNIAGDGEILYSEVAEIYGKRLIAIPEILLRLLMGFSWKLRLQSDSPTSGLEFIKYPPVISNEKLKREIGYQFRYSPREALLSFWAAKCLDNLG